MWVVLVSEVRLICIGKLPEHFNMEETMYIPMYNVALGPQESVQLRLHWDQCSREVLVIFF